MENLRLQLGETVRLRDGHVMVQFVDVDRTRVSDDVWRKGFNEFSSAVFGWLDGFPTDDGDELFWDISMSMGHLLFEGGFEEWDEDDADHPDGGFQCLDYSSEQSLRESLIGALQKSGVEVLP